MLYTVLILQLFLNCQLVSQHHALKNDEYGFHVLVQVCFLLSTATNLSLSSKHSVQIARTTPPNSSICRSAFLCFTLQKEAPMPENILNHTPLLLPFHQHSWLVLTGCSFLRQISVRHLFKNVKLLTNKSMQS